VLKYGSMIVDNLRVFQHPVFVYIPHEAEIRGGAWVVIDPNINPAQMEMYAADVCRGGVLEPEACAQLKYPETDIIKTMHRLDPNIASMSPEEQEVPPENCRRRCCLLVFLFFILLTKMLTRSCLQRHQHELMPAYKTLAVQFAAMHDGPKVRHWPHSSLVATLTCDRRSKSSTLMHGSVMFMLSLASDRVALSTSLLACERSHQVMLEKGIVKAIVPWVEARLFFAKQLRRRLAQEMIKKHARRCWPGADGDVHAAQAVVDLNEHIEAIVDRDGEVVRATPQLTVTSVCVSLETARDVALCIPLINCQPSLANRPQRMDLVDVEIYMAKLRKGYIEFTVKEFSKEAGVGLVRHVADEVAHEQLNADLRNGGPRGGSKTRRVSHCSLDSFSVSEQRV
jgi:hypothetical protein